MAIYLTTGIPGSFKTLSTIGRVIQRQEDDRKAGLDRPVYACNINNMQVPGWETLDSGINWPDCPDGSIIVIDECQKEDMGFGRMSTTAKVPKHIADLETHRHRGIDIYLITQGPHLINSHVKPLVDTHWHYLRKYGWDKATVYQSTGIIKNPETKSNLSDCEKLTYKPDPKLYAYYDSATLHTVKKRIPKAIAYGVPALMLCALGIFFGVRTVLGLADKGAANAPDAPVEPLTSITAMDTAVISEMPAQAPQEAFNPMTAFIPRIEAMPETAPAYDDLRKPLDYPRPQCVLNVKKNICNCYSQQATLLKDYPAELCASYVADGYFDATKPRTQSANFDNQRQENNNSG